MFPLYDICYLKRILILCYPIREIILIVFHITLYSFLHPLSIKYIAINNSGKLFKPPKHIPIFNPRISGNR